MYIGFKLSLFPSTSAILAPVIVASAFFLDNAETENNPSGQISTSVASNNTVIGLSTIRSNQRRNSPSRCTAV